jgi:hypothetical protein
VQRDTFGGGDDGGDIEAAPLGDDSALRRLRRSEVAVGGGLVVNGRDETIVSLDPVSQLRHIHQARNVDMICAQQRQQHAAYERTRHRARSRVCTADTLSLAAPPPVHGSVDTSAAAAA